MLANLINRTNNKMKKLLKRLPHIYEYFVLKGKTIRAINFSHFIPHLLKSNFLPSRSYELFINCIQIH